MMKRLMTGVAAVALVMGGMAFFGVFGAGASGPAITITPNTGLVDMQQIQITGTGFAPNLGTGSTVALECLATATTAAGCNTATGSYVLVTSNASGDVSFFFDVAAGTVGNGTCGTSATDATCQISVATVATSTVLASAPITFASGGGTTTTTTTIAGTTTTTTTTVPPTTTTTIAGATPPNIQVSPSTGLTNGASVSVTGADFTPADSVFALECLATATSSAGCDLATATPITVNADGTLPATTFKVVTGTVGTGTCGTTSSDLSNCIIEVANAAAGDSGATPITFMQRVVAAPAPKATKTTGSAVPGKSSVITVSGSHFTAVSKVTCVGTVSVRGVSASKLTLSIKEAASAKKGTYTMTIHFKSGKTTTVKYKIT